MRNDNARKGLTAISTLALGLGLASIAALPALADHHESGEMMEETMESHDAMGGGQSPHDMTEEAMEGDMHEGDMHDGEMMEDGHMDDSSKSGDAMMDGHAQ